MYSISKHDHKNLRRIRVCDGILVVKLMRGQGGVVRGSGDVRAAIDTTVASRSGREEEATTSAEVSLS